VGLSSGYTGLESRIVIDRYSYSNVSNVIQVIAPIKVEFYLYFKSADRIEKEVKVHGLEQLDRTRQEFGLDWI
jgi:hypothetical protein